MPHIHKLYDFAVSAYIVFENKVLLVRHPRYNQWLPPGGHVELHEDPEQALFREIEEETGLSVSLVDSAPKVDAPGVKFLVAPRYIDVHQANEPHKHIALTYFARATHGKARLSQEHQAIRWFAETDLADPAYALSPAVQFYSREAIKSAGSKR